MAKPTHVLLSFIHGRLQKLLDFGREHHMQTSQGTLKNATIAMNIINFILDLRHDPVVDQILTRERINLWTYIERIHTQYATQKGYLREKGR